MNRLLILSFSDISQDARVRKQVELFASRYEVTTCGFGPGFREDIEHVELVDDTPQWFKYLEAIALRARGFAVAYGFHPRALAARRALRGRHFDAVLANDLDTIGTAHSLVSGERVHADLHEYFPGLNDQDSKWTRLRKPFHEWALRKYVVAAGSVTTVSDTIAEKYRDEFGIRCGVVRNAAPFADLNAAAVRSPIRIVHSGGAQPNRRIEVMMEAAAKAEADATLDLYLTGVGTPYHDSLLELASTLGDRVHIYPPVPQSELLALLNTYDVGIHVLPPTNTNNRLALPNKFFDYVQARLALLIGPSADMERLLRKHDLGLVADGFDTGDIVKAIDSLTPEDVARWKANSDSAAHANSAEAQEVEWVLAVAARL